MSTPHADARTLAGTRLTAEQRRERASKAGRASAAKLTPEQRQERARKAAEARFSVEAHIKAIVAAAPILTDEQINALRPILAGGNV